ncbi:MAG: hypothetical protein SynsKO_42980 [Synoicihabitans sp.]
MAEIVAAVGPTEARELVLNAYNAEILSNRLGRLEDHKAAVKLAGDKASLLRLALLRVHEVVNLLK